MAAIPHDPGGVFFGVCGFFQSSDHHRHEQVLGHGQEGGGGVNQRVGRQLFVCTKNFTCERGESLIDPFHFPVQIRSTESGVLTEGRNFTWATIGADVGQGVRGGYEGWKGMDGKNG